MFDLKSLEKMITPLKEMPKHTIYCDGIVFVNVEGESPEWVSYLAKTDNGMKILTTMIEEFISKNKLDPMFFEAN